MRKGILLALTLSVLLSGAGMASAATKKVVKPAPKKAPVKPAAPTVQLPGDNGVFGTVYSMNVEGKVYFRLKSAEYTTNQVVMGDTFYTPKADEKLLVLHFAVQNPLKTEQTIRWDTLRFTAVDAMNENHECESHWANEDNPDHPKLEMSVKPAQTVNAYACLPVPAKGITPKLMVLPSYEGNGKVLRYDLRNPANKVAPLTAPIADPADTSGYTALETVPGQLGVFYPYNNFDIAVQSFAYTSDKLDSDAPEEGARYLIATLVMKNDSPEKPTLRWDTISPILTSTDGEELEYKNMLLATANRPIEREAKPGEETTVRIYFLVPKDVTPKTLAIKEYESRTYEFPVTVQ